MCQRLCAGALVAAGQRPGARQPAGESRFGENRHRDEGAGMTNDTVTHRGGCHCGRVRFEVDAPAAVEALECNCSICRMSGFVHLIVPAARFRLLSGSDVLSEYTFNTGTAKHRFCSHCGVKSFYVPRSNPDGVDVNLRCIDAGTIVSVAITPFDDGDRARSEAAIAHL
jgi:hypothetical protein